MEIRVLHVCLYGNFFLFFLLVNWQLLFMLIQFCCILIFPFFCNQVHESLQRIRERKLVNFIEWGPASIQVYFFFFYKFK